MEQIHEQRESTIFIHVRNNRLNSRRGNTFRHPNNLWTALVGLHSEAQVYARMTTTFFVIPNQI